MARKKASPTAIQRAIGHDLGALSGRTCKECERYALRYSEEPLCSRHASPEVKEHCRRMLDAEATLTAGAIHTTLDRARRDAYILQYVGTRLVGFCSNLEPTDVPVRYGDRELQVDTSWIFDWEDEARAARKRKEARKAEQTREAVASTIEGDRVSIT